MWLWGGGVAGGIYNVTRRGGVGDSGDINITTGSLRVTGDGARLDTPTFGGGKAGNVNIVARDTVTFEGTNVGAVSNVEEGTGKGGNINITTRSLRIIKGAQLAAVTFGEGDAGNVNIVARDTVTFDGGVVGTATLDKGDGGNIIITTGILEVLNGARISASTLAEGKAGNIEITANTFEASNGSEIVSNTSSQFPAGNIILNVKDNITLSGSDTGIFANTTEDSTGQGGAITIDPRTLTIRDGATISVDSQGAGIGGDIELSAGLLTLDNGTISAETRSNTGGNIILNLQDSLLLSNESQISSTAGNQEFGGNGGNITINTPLIVAFPNENSDITANAFNGSGGKIDISAQGIFGIEEREALEGNQTNDIDASSEFGLDGTVQINEPDVNPAEALEELPIEVIDVAGLVAQNLCQQLKGSEFIVTGKGGIAPNPSQVRDGEVVEVDLVEPAPFVEDGAGRGVSRNARRGWLFALEEVKEEIIEAQGWMINDRGILELIAYKTDLNGSPAQPKDEQICPN